MLAVVTGSSGFIGSNLVARLLADGHRVRRLLRADAAHRAPPIAGAEAAERVEVRLDDADALVRSGALSDAEIVFHLAGATRARDAAAYAAANVAPTAALLRAAERSAEQLRRFVLVSSQAAAGPAPSLDRPTQEDDEPRPIERYGASKLAAERLAAASSLPVTIVRPSAVYGPGDADFLALFRAARRGVTAYPGTRDGWLSLVHVDDLLVGLLAAATSEASVGRTYFLGSAVPVRWREVYAAVARAADSRPLELSLPMALARAALPVASLVGRVTGRVPLLNADKLALAAAPFWVCSSERAARELGFRADRTLPDGMLGTYLWYLRAGWLGPALRPRALERG